MSRDGTSQALQACLDVLLRMIPEFCEQTGVEVCTDVEHDAAIAKAAAVVYGPNRDAWPAAVRRAAAGEFA